MHLDTGALAVGALPVPETAAVEEHLRACESCRAELAGFRETVAMLASVAAQAPPASLRRSVLAAIAVTPQLPPLAGPPPIEPSVEPAAASEPYPGRHGAQDESSATAQVLPLRPWYRRPAALIAAAVAAVAIGAGAVVISQTGGRGEQVAQTTEQCVAGAADRTRYTPDHGSGSVDYAASCSAATVEVSGLPALPDERTYQLWALSADPAAAPRSLGVLPQAADGQQQVVTETTRPGEVGMAITAEPAGGSAAPTTPVVWTTSMT